SGPARRALRFLRRSLLAREVRGALLPFDARLAAAEIDNPAGYRNLPLLLAGEPDPERRAQLFGSQLAFLEARVNPILEQRQAAADAAARAAGHADGAALAEELREVDLGALLAEGVRYLQATEAVY